MADEQSVGKIGLDLVLLSDKLEKSIKETVEKSAQKINEQFSDVGKKVNDELAKTTDNVNKKISATTEKVKEKISEPLKALNPEAEKIKTQFDKIFDNIKIKAEDFAKKTQSEISDRMSTAFASLNDVINNTNNELGKINELLDFDPTNTELLTQKSNVLANTVENAKEKLSSLKMMNDEFENGLNNGSVSDTDFRLYKRQVIEAEQELRKAEKALHEFENESQNTSEKVSDDVKEIKKQVENTTNSAKKEIKEVGETTNKINAGIGASLKKLGGTFVAAFSVKVIADFTKECTNLGSDLAEVQNVVDVTFTKMSDKINLWANNASQSFGLSETMAKKYAGTLGAMASAYGFSENKAYDMSTALAGLAGDVASFYNLDQETAFNKLKAVFSGETEGLKDLGVVMTQTALDSYALANGYGKTTSAMTEAEKVTLRYNFVLDKLSKAQGDFSRTSDGWANQVRILKLNFDNFKGSIGQGLINVFTPFLQLLNRLVEKLKETGSVFQKFTEKVFGVSASNNSISNIADSAEILSTNLDEVSESAENAKGNLAGFDKLNVLSNSSTSEDKTTAQNADNETSVVDISTEKSEKAVSHLTGIIDKLKDKIKLIGKWFEPVTDNFKRGFQNIKIFAEKYADIANASIQRMAENTKSAVKNLFSGIGNLLLSVSNIISDAFNITTGSLVKWIEKDVEVISDYFDNIQRIVADVFNFFGDVFNDISTILSDWWDKTGADVFEKICDALLDVGTTVLNVFNQWIMPIWNAFVDIMRSLWFDCLSPIFEKLLNFFTKIIDGIVDIWNFISPFINYIINGVKPIIVTVLNIIKNVVQTVFKFIGDLIGGLIDTLSGVVDFIVGIFTLNFDKAIIGVVEIIVGAMEMIWAGIKGAINLIITGLNALWSAIYEVVAGVVNGVGSLAGLIGDALGQDWHFSLPDIPPTIPLLAKGGLVTAPTLAVVGDNKGAGSGDPEVVAPLSKLQGMINTSSGEDVVILNEILVYLKKLYELFIVFRNSGGNIYEFIATIDGEKIFNEMVKLNNLYKKRHNGKSAFA